MQKTCGCKCVLQSHINLRGNNEMSKQTYEVPFPVDAGSDAAAIQEALAAANEKFWEILQAKGLDSLNGVEGSYDRGGCGHDRS